jgi:hypothetical protein
MEGCVREEGCAKDRGRSVFPQVPGIIAGCADFVELTGERGDVVLMHPFMLHTVSGNPSGRPRVITNPAPVRISFS